MLESSEVYLEIPKLSLAEHEVGYILFDGGDQVGLFPVPGESIAYNEYYDQQVYLEPFETEDETGRAGNWGAIRIRWDREKVLKKSYYYKRLIERVCGDEFKLYYFSLRKWRDGPQVIESKSKEHLHDNCPQNLNPEIPITYAQRAVQEKVYARPLPYEKKWLDGKWHVLVYFDGP
ncbi:MAG: hypothetical protein NZM25_07855 [Leptospiraceae bacterium]|nr:hypothetical protein [Leptospiraceae bacterium]MDW8305514.1 hypothetical protein [Leptospiraceae bacterium]